MESDEAPFHHLTRILSYPMFLDSDRNANMEASRHNKVENRLTNTAFYAVSVNLRFYTKSVTILSAIAIDNEKKKKNIYMDFFLINFEMEY